MPIIATSSGDGDFKSLDAGTYIARCISIWAIGTQYNKWHDKWQPQVVLRWEVPEETTEDGTPSTISSFYTISLHEKSNLYKALVAWRGRKFTDDELARFDLETVLGAPCLLTVVHSDDGKQKVGAVSKLGKGMVCPDAHHRLESYSMAEDIDGKGYAALPEWVQKQVDQSRERMPITEGADNRRPLEPATATTMAGGDDDDIPFAKVDSRLI